MEDLKLLSEKLDVSVVACVRYSPWGGLPKMDYLKTECGVWYTYDVTSPPLTQEECSTFGTFMAWIETDHGDDWWVYTLGDMVVDENTIEELNSLLTTKPNQSIILLDILFRRICPLVDDTLKYHSIRCKEDWLLLVFGQKVNVIRRNI